MNMRGMSGKWNAMWHSSPSPKYGAHVGRPLVRLGEQHAVGIRARRARARICLRIVVRLVEVLADRAFALDQVGNGVEPQAVDAAIEPEPHHLDHRLEHRRVVEVQVRLVVEEPVPVVRPWRCRPSVQFDFSVSVKMIRTPWYFWLVSLQT